MAVKKKVSKGVKPVMQKKKINKSQLLSGAAKKHGIDLAILQRDYSIIVDEIVEKAKQGYEVSLTGFGVYVLKKHKGHPVQFGSKSTHVKDYEVLKFSASDALNRKLREPVDSQEE